MKSLLAILGIALLTPCCSEKMSAPPALSAPQASYDLTDAKDRQEFWKRYAVVLQRAAAGAQHLTGFSGWEKVGCKGGACSVNVTHTEEVGTVVPPEGASPRMVKIFGGMYDPKSKALVAFAGGFDAKGVEEFDCPLLPGATTTHKQSERGGQRFDCAFASGPLANMLVLVRVIGDATTVRLKGPGEKRAPSAE